MKEENNFTEPSELMEKYVTGRTLMFVAVFLLVATLLYFSFNKVK